MVREKLENGFCAGWSTSRFLNRRKGTKAKPVHGKCLKSSELGFNIPMMMKNRRIKNEKTPKPLAESL